MAITEAQSQLLKRIIELTREDDRDRHARWAGAAPDAKKYAEDGYLLLGRGWVFDFVLSQEGVVFVAPTEKKGPLRRASPLEVLCGLYPAIQVYPELLSFLPSRGKDSIECPSCKGMGFIGGLRKSGAQTAQPNCICGGAGWLPSDYQTQLPIGESW